MLRNSFDAAVKTLKAHKWPWAAGTAGMALVAGATLAFAGLGPNSGTEPAVAEQAVSASPNSAKPTKAAESEGTEKDTAQSEPAITNTQVAPVGAQPLSGPEVPKVSERQEAARAPQIPPKPVGIVGSGEMATVGSRGSIHPGQYIFFGEPGLSIINQSYRHKPWGTIGADRRSPVITLTAGDQIAFGNTIAYTPEQVAIIDQYYGGVG